MKKAVLEDVRKIVVRDVPIPKPKSNEVLIKVRYCSICGTDLHSYKLGPEIPPKMKRLPESKGIYGSMGKEGGGHQYSGEIVEVGSDINKWKVGDRVTAVGFGAYAEYVTASCVYSLPKEVSYEQGAFTEPLGVAVAAVRRSKLQLGDTVVVLGGGTMGLLTLQCAKEAGAKRVYITEIAEKRIELARRFADEVLNPKEVDVLEKVNELTNGIGPDVIFECAGKNETIKQLVEMARERPWESTPYSERTRAVIVAIYEKPWTSDLFDPNIILAKNLVILGSYCYEPYGHPKDELRTAIDLMRNRKIEIDPLITAKVPLNDIEKAFKTLLKGEEMAILIQP